ncbi:MAG: hypothetical protein QOG20_1641 [Pseudonocardiales bacterium]|nr:hypothetical protein [Pseudonocardiales bacterium]
MLPWAAVQPEGRTSAWTRTILMGLRALSSLMATATVLAYAIAGFDQASHASAELSESVIQRTRGRT